jgi:eukaryotic-like serine/threonine-protein kinase
MNSERWRRIEDLLHEALEKAPNERRSFLDSVCAHDPDLRGEVESLLAYEQSSSGFLHSAVGEAVRAIEAASNPSAEGRRVGPYRIIRRIGEGGMGAVYLAARADDQFQKQVAIKLVKRGMDTEYILRRFRFERQILARLDHPFIARLLDGGAADDGSPYLVMEYIDGKPLIEYCEAHGLSTRDRLQIFLRVCAAVHYAHQNLVVHRDLKPGNILVMADGTPKLLDFGVAKLLDPGDGGQTVLATRALRMMTPDYASPEQVRGEVITTATDVYLLGAVLYELLSGERPHKIKTSSAIDIERAICIDDLVRPSLVARQRKLSGDLDNIVLLAMQKDPQRRYPSALDLSEDIRRHLDGRPVVAREDTVWYRAGKFIRRHKVGVMATALIALSLIGGILAATYQARRAERRFEQVRKLAHSFVFEVHDAIRDLPGSTKARQLVVARALEYLDSLAQESGGDGRLLRELAAAYQRIGDVQGYILNANLGNAAGALESYRKGISLAERLVAGNPADTSARLMLATLQSRVGEMQVYTADMAGSIESLRRAQAIAEKVVASSPGNRDATQELAHIHSAMGSAYGRMVKNADAIESTRHALEIYEQLASAQGENNYASERATCYSNIGMAQARMNDPAAALENYRKALAIQQELVAKNATNIAYKRDLMLAYSHVGDALGNPTLTNVGDTKGAVEAYRKMLAVAESMVSADPSNKLARTDYAISLMRVANAIPEGQDHAEALRLFRQALRLMEELTAENPRNTMIQVNQAFTSERIGNRLLALGDRAAAAESYRKTIAITEALIKADPTEISARRILAGCYIALARTLAAQHDRFGAIETGLKALPVAEHLTTKNASSPRSATSLAQAYAGMGSVYDALAQSDPGPAYRREDRRTACEWYRKSQTSWMSVKETVPLAKDQFAEMEKTAAAAARCDGSADAR